MTDLETADLEAFRLQVREFVSTHLPERIARAVLREERLSRQDFVDWHHILYEQGWLASHWPVEYGGPGWSSAQRYIFDNETALLGAPRLIPFGLNMLGPVLIKYCSQEQRDHWLPRILSGADWWCQGFSEPEAGSDLASLRTTAVRDGDHYVVNGQKTWTTLGHYANMIFCLVRTDPAVKPQRGISFLLIDMSTPGVEVRPIITLDGEHEVNEVFFSDVRVPVENLVGQENDGWTYAKYLLTYERTNIAGVGPSLAALRRLKESAGARIRGGRPLAEDPAFAARVARVEIDLDNMFSTNLRVIEAADNGGAPGVESSMLKIRGTQIRQEITALQRQATGAYARPLLPDQEDPVGPDGDDTAMPSYFNNRKLSIFGGSNEIQRNIIAASVLGL